MRCSRRAHNPSKLVHQGINPDKETGAILTPIVQSTTFIQDSVEEYLVRDSNSRGFYRSVLRGRGVGGPVLRKQILLLSLKAFVVRAFLRPLCW